MMRSLVRADTGVEHSASIYLQRRKPVVPLDLPLGASRDDGTGGAHRLSKEARSDPARFFRFAPAFSYTEGAALATTATRDGTAPHADISTGVVELISKLAQPTAFFVRLVNSSHAKFKSVESFFRDVVDPVVAEAGLTRVEIGTDTSEHLSANRLVDQLLECLSAGRSDTAGKLFIVRRQP